MPEDKDPTGTRRSRVFFHLVLAMHHPKSFKNTSFPTEFRDSSGLSSYDHSTDLTSGPDGPLPVAVARLLDLPDLLSAAQSVPAAASAAAGRAVLVPSHTVAVTSSNGCCSRHRKIGEHEAVSMVVGRKRRDRQDRVGGEKGMTEGADGTAAGRIAAAGTAAAGSDKEASGPWADRTRACAATAAAAAAAEREDRTLPRKVEGTAVATGTKAHSTSRLKGEVRDGGASSRAAAPAAASDHTPVLLPPTCGRFH